MCFMVMCFYGPFSSRQRQSASDSPSPAPSVVPLPRHSRFCFHDTPTMQCFWKHTQQFIWWRIMNSIFWLWLFNYRRLQMYTRYYNNTYHQNWAGISKPLEAPNIVNVCVFEVFAAGLLAWWYQTANQADLIFFTRWINVHEWYS